MLSRLSPLVVLLPIQAVILFWNLDLLSIWSDEAFTIYIAQRSIAEIPRLVAADIHPPLYYLLLKIWSWLPWPWEGVAELRAFSCVWALVSTILLDRLWLRRWLIVDRATALALFALAPCLILYGRMARSYTMQVALTLIAVWALWRLVEHRTGLATAVLASLALLYTHYIPGIAVVLGFTIIAVRRLPTKQMAWFAAGILAGYLPWLLVFTSAVSKWREAASFSASYALTGSTLTEHALKLAFGAISLSIGETWYPASLLLVPLLLIAILAAWRSGRQQRPLMAMLAVAAALGYLGVSRWVAYPFVPARLLWLLPFLVIAVVSIHWRWLNALLLLSALASVPVYYSRAGYMNVGYTAPLREIAAGINRQADSTDGILIDGYNVDDALRFYLDNRASVTTLTEDQIPSAQRLISQAKRIWIISNQRDISPGQITTRLTNIACDGATTRNVQLYVPFATWQRALFPLLGIPPNVTHHYQVTVCTKP